MKFVIARSRLDEFCALKGISRTELGRRLSIKKQQMQRYADGANMTITTAKALANVLGCNIDDLFILEPEERG